LKANFLIRNKEDRLSSQSNNSGNLLKYLSEKFDDKLVSIGSYLD
jgi:hypothetical protein